jgi:hydrogenase small subunit
VKDYLASKGIGTPVINVPGCPPHPDWTVYPVAYILAMSTPSSIAYPPMDQWGRPQAVFSGSGNHGDPYAPFCLDCPNKDTQGTPQAAQQFGDAGCLGGKGCKGPYTVGDCPIRGKNTTDDGFSMNWCVGASGQNSNPNAPAVSHIGEARHPCQGCIQPDFPDWRGLTPQGDKTSKRVKGFYNE